MTKSNTLVALLVAFVSSQANAACTLKSAQDKMMMVNNMAQVYSQESFDYMEKGESPPAALTAKQATVFEETNVHTLKLAKVSEANPSIGLDDEVDMSICDGFDSVLANHKPAGYQAAPIAREQKTDDPSCNSTSLWERFGVSIQQQTELVQAGKIDQQEMAKYLKITTNIGTLSTTDLKKACAAQTDFENKLASE